MPVNKKLSKRALAFFLMFVAIVVYAVNLQLAKTTFYIKNSSSEAINVTASWDGQIKSLGSLTPRQEVPFEVKEQGAIKFKANYASGKISTAIVPSYTLGSDITVVISDANITVRGQ
ncbi:MULTISPECIES: hypothetical protein [Motilimonas]|uniref:Uncharacterized protein n=1 Tax=Motilimonas cestriensis TaxID=2742685 RepID=A0ABS8WCX7_9GAMM|nr:MULTISPECIES: hypothetical protein [Motilimonas]MCE0558056.1 hypothetical protein [Motilimonas sp. E26]MCE2596177.1 hypothetical protein [Motilimonas cestriensis]MDO6526061.1 hypothetical protein [Motilimonas sp. 1_MG-2023]